MNFFDRFKEPSTWAGLGVLASIVGVPVTTYQLIQQVGMGIAGLLAVVLAERAKNRD